jgi:murein DD-endopeptidase MepM/ murein hydrolase activator NlpD
MRSGPRGVTIVVQRDGTTRSRTLRVPRWALRFGTLGGVVVLLGVGLAGALYLPIVRAAARVPGLERRVAILQADNARVRELSAALDSVEQRYAQVRQMIGADIVRDPLGYSSPLPLAPSVFARPPGALPTLDVGPSAPRGWPLDEPGYVTRGQIGTGSPDEPHPGLDIAVATGTIVRASGGATVKQAGEDPEYGLFVLLDHPEGYQSMYGHLSRILVGGGSTVSRGEAIGLSGNSGRSTAPHLHFEIRQGGNALDPRTMVKQGA